jgi:tagatose 1,6-diphosphate aldolase
MAAEISAGKLRNLMSLADENGRLKMMAIDQRGSLNQSLSKVLGREASFDEVAEFKQIVTEVLAPYSTALLTDPIYGYARSVLSIPGNVGLLLAYEATGYAINENEKGRKTTLIEGWDVATARRAGANAIKLLLYYHPDAEPDTVQFQKDLCQRVGEECAAHDLPFLLETVAYAIEEPGTDSPAYARRKPELVRRSAEEFSDPKYGVDILKLEFPGELKYSREYCNGVFDGKDREPVYSLDDVRGFCKAVDDAAKIPWVILSAGVDIKEFLVDVDLACQAGASGFLCGRAIWKGAIPLFNDRDEMENHLATEGVINFEKCLAGAEYARPFWEHPCFEDSGVAGDDENWHRTFGRG